MMTRPMRRRLPAVILVAALLGVPRPAAPQQAPPGPSSERPPSADDVLRGEYGRYRANNDLLSYRLDVRVDPERKSIAGTNTIRFKRLAPDTRIQLDLYDNLAIDEIRLGAAPLQYDRELNTVFVRFPAVLE